VSSSFCKCLEPFSFCVFLHFAHGRELEFAPTGRGFREKEEIIGELNGSGNAGESHRGEVTGR